MTRLIDALTQFFDDDGDPADGWELYFYSSGTTTLKDTYSDLAQTIANTNPITLDAAGKPSDGSGNRVAIYGSGTYRVVLKDSDGVQIELADNVLASVVTGAFAAYSADSTYNQYDIVIATNNKYYRSREDDNIGNEPSASTDEWELLPFPVETWTEKDDTDDGYETYGWAAEFIDADTSSAAWELVLHASPSDGDKVGVHDFGGSFSTYNLTVSSSDSKDIGGAGVDFVCDIDNLTVYFVFDSTNDNWRVLI